MYFSYFIVDLKKKNDRFQTEVAESKKSPSVSSKMISIENSKYFENLTSKISSLELQIVELQNKKESLNPCKSTKNKKTNIFRSCLELLNNGFTKSGKYEINPFLNVTKTVYCDQDTEGGGWTVFLRNAHGLISFNKKWNEYKDGFGTVEYDFWLGNEFMHNATNLYNSHISKTAELYIMVASADDKKFYVMYKNFAILSEATNYTLQVSNHLKGTMGDALEYHNNVKFSTKDRDNDDVNTVNCATKFGGYGWWFKKCYFAFLTRMKYDKVDVRLKPTPEWYYIYNDYRSLKNATMMFREKM